MRSHLIQARQLPSFPIFLTKAFAVYVKEVAGQAAPSDGALRHLAGTP
jgi:hypothetical protein